MSESVIEVRGLEVRYGRRRVLWDLDLAVPAGSVTAVLGVNGAGKSTLMRALTGEVSARRGEVRVLGLDSRRNAVAVKRTIGYVPDRTELPRWMTIAEHLRFLAAFYPTWDSREARRLVELFGLDEAMRYAELSKGQRALENLVAALAHRPALLLLDEPFASLDPLARRRVFDGVLEHLKGDGTTALLVSHSLVDVQRCADRVALLKRGCIGLEGDLEEVCRGAARLAVELRCDSPWDPPGDPVVEIEGREMVLFYLDLDDGLRRRIEDDPMVASVRELPRDLEDVVVAATEREVAA